MAAAIQVSPNSKAAPFQFEVIVGESRGQTRHAVSLSGDDYRRLAGDGYSPEACIEAAFRFLLDREPKESILPRFDLALIARYFPEFERELPHYLFAAKRG